MEELLFFTADNDELVALDVTEGGNAHEGPKFEDRDWKQYLLSLKPFGLGLLLNTNCGVSILRQRGDHHRKGNDLPLYCRCKPARESIFLVLYYDHRLCSFTFSNSLFMRIGQRNGV